MPDDQAMEKQSILRSLGAVVHVVPNSAISNPNHYANVARRIAQDINKREIRFGQRGGGDVVVQAAFIISLKILPTIMHIIPRPVQKFGIKRMDEWIYFVCLVERVGRFQAPVNT